MSADNRICIMQEDGNWYAWHGSLSCDYYEAPSNAEFFHTEQEALSWAESEIKDMVICEGGICYIHKGEQLRGITNMIEYLQVKKSRLERDGKPVEDGF
jgi:hypothetical protein